MDASPSSVAKVLAGHSGFGLQASPNTPFNASKRQSGGLKQPSARSFDEPANEGRFIEATHSTVAYSLCPTSRCVSCIGRVPATVHEITQQVIHERRLAVLCDLGARSSEARTAEEACQVAAEIFGQHPKDVPFALLYVLDAEQRTARLAGAAGARASDPVAPSLIDLAIEGRRMSIWSLATLLRTNKPELVENLPARCGAVPAVAWSDPPHNALVLPVPSNAQHRRRAS